jgi:hypothetical protein
MDKCLQSWLKACGDDYSSYFSEDNFAEISVDNGWEYTKDGKLFK